jgi:hypothetical protein
VTTGENVWGTILVRDIATSPLLGTIAGLELRALRIEDLFLLKLASGRARDLSDLELLAQRTTADALVDRWNQLIKWHGDRHAVLGFADALVVQLEQRYGSDPVAIIARLEVTGGQRVATRQPSWKSNAMILSADVEREILDDEKVLEQVAALLEGGAEVTTWPEDLRMALIVALHDPHMARAEGWKAVTLRRHLFGPSDAIPESLAMSREPSAIDRRRAERLRSGIPGCVRYRSGRYLIRASGRSATHGPQRRT